MELMNWIFAAIALGSGLLLGELAGRLTRSATSRSTEHPLLAQSSRSIGNAVFWVSVLIGLIVAAGLLNPRTLESFGRSFSEEIPSLLLAGAWLIGGYATATAVSAMVGQSALKATGVRQGALERTLRLTIIAASIAAALNQAGVDSGIVTVVVGIAVAAPALTIVILGALGGRHIASHVAAGRVLRHHLRVGDRISAPNCEGVIVALHSTCVEVQADSGSFVQVPNSRLVDLGYERQPGQRSRI